MICITHNGTTLKEKSWEKGINIVEGGTFRKVEHEWFI